VAASDRANPEFAGFRVAHDGDEVLEGLGPDLQQRVDALVARVIPPRASPANPQVGRQTGQRAFVDAHHPHPSRVALRDARKALRGAQALTPGERVHECVAGGRCDQ
jgi:hypothetical protein